jgi:hypothetical protein
MKSKEFLKDRLFRIFSSISNLSIKYQHFSEKNLHLIQIIPLQDVLADQNFIVQKLNLIHDFKKNFPAEKLTFVDENSNVKLTSPEFSFSKIKGKSVIETRSLQSYSPSFTLMVTEDVNKIRSL